MDYNKIIKNNSVISPFFSFSKKYFYNRYVARKLFASSFPPEVWIENTNCCNAKCIMCPREQQTRPLGFMKFSLFEKIVKEIAEHKDVVERLHLHNYGEPLLDKELPDRIKLAKDYGIKHIYFVTNASLLTPDLSEKIISAGIDEFKISFYGIDKKSYHETMKGLDFEKTIQNIKYFFKIRTVMKVEKPKVIIQYLPQEKNESRAIALFKDIFTPIIQKNIGDTLNVFSLHNFGNGRDYNESQTERITTTCNYPWRTMVILHDGRIAICCLDYNGVQVVNDVNVSTIEEIWNGEQYKKIRDDFKKLKYNNNTYPICMKCDVIRK